MISSPQPSKSKTFKAVGEEQWKRMEKMPADLYHLLYGAIVADYWRQSGQDPAKTNSHLDKLGYSIGLRAAEEFCARLSTAPVNLHGDCDWHEVGEGLGRIGFKMFFGWTPVIVHGPSNEFILVLGGGGDDEGVALLARDVVLPDHNLSFLQVYCGMIRGGMEALGYGVECHVDKDTLKGDAQTELRVVLIERLEEDRPPED